MSSIAQADRARMERINERLGIAGAENVEDLGGLHETMEEPNKEMSTKSD